MQYGIYINCGYSSVVERLVANENVARSNRVTRQKKEERWQSGSMHRF